MTKAIFNQQELIKTNITFKSFSASWNETFAASNKQHFSSSGLNRLYGSIPKRNA
jgi:hypothetical protein